MLSVTGKEASYLQYRGKMNLERQCLSIAVGFNTAILNLPLRTRGMRHLFAGPRRPVRDTERDRLTRKLDSI